MGTDLCSGHRDISPVEVSHDKTFTEDVSKRVDLTGCGAAAHCLTELQDSGRNSDIILFNKIYLVENMHEPITDSSNTIQHLVHYVCLLDPVLNRHVDDMQENIGMRHLLQRGLEASHKMVR